MSALAHVLVALASVPLLALLWLAVTLLTRATGAGARRTACERSNRGICGCGVGATCSPKEKTSCD